MTHKDKDKRTEENNKLLAQIYKNGNNYVSKFKEVTGYTEKFDDDSETDDIFGHRLLVLMDISRSLAIIADKLDKED